MRCEEIRSDKVPASRCLQFNKFPEQPARGGADHGGDRKSFRITAALSISGSCCLHSRKNRARCDSDSNWCGKCNRI